jgi:hypothetical protein
MFIYESTLFRSDAGKMQAKNWVIFRIASATSQGDRGQHGQKFVVNGHRSAATRPGTVSPDIQLHYNTPN